MTQQRTIPKTEEEVAKALSRMTREELRLIQGFILGRASREQPDARDSA